MTQVRFALEVITRVAMLFVSVTHGFTQMFERGESVLSAVRHGIFVDTKDSSMS